MYNYLGFIYSHTNIQISRNFLENCIYMCRYKKNTTILHANISDAPVCMLKATNT
jgi:hypothetical protein